jgi:glycosyltransferase involved in cell wall biosynthesis
LQQVTETARPSVSFVIPARNERKLIADCVRSIQALDYKGEVEILVVDNGSFDGTPDMAELCGAKVICFANLTIGRLRNIGATHAIGEFLAFIDADCVVEKAWLTKALCHFVDPTVACVGSYTGVPDGSSWVQQAWALQNKPTESVEEVDWLPSRSILVRTRAFQSVSGFDESLITCEDVDFCYRLRKARYKVISDHSLKSVHFGEAETLAEFFRKEAWRGQSNLRGVLAHGFYLQEIPSLSIPAFYLVLTMLLPILSTVAFTTGMYRPVIINLVLFPVPAVGLALRRSFRTCKFKWIGHLSILYLLSSLARTYSLLALKHDDGHRDASCRTVAS